MTEFSSEFSEKERKRKYYSFTFRLHLLVLHVMFDVFHLLLLSSQTVFIAIKKKRKKRNPFQRVGHWEEGNCKYPLIAPDGLSMKMSILWMQQKEESGRYEYEQ